MTKKQDKIIVSLGGNAIVRRGERGTIEEQFENARAACEYVAEVASSGAVIITHGNGPIVGNLVIQNDAAKDFTPAMPLYICDADSEGGIGFVIQQTLYNRLHKTHNLKNVVTIVTQIVVDANDPAFSYPTKPVGPYYSEAEARALRKAKGWVMTEDSNRGWRRVVPSPKPRKIIEADVINKLSQEGVIVIAAGGGGVPVIEDELGMLSGVDAVIDKDLATALLAKVTGAKRFINLTQIDMVYLNFGRPDAKGISEMSASDAKKYLDEGQFARGSMGPKIEAAIEFLMDGGEEVIITSPEALKDALNGRAGTRIRK